MCERWVISRVSRTLWSVMSTPMPSPRQVLHDALQLRDGDRVDAGERLVEQEELRLDGQRPGDLRAPPLAAREGVGGLPAQVRDAQLVEQLVEEHRLLAAGQVRPGLEDGRDVVLDGELAEHRGLLRQVGDAQARAPVHGQAVTSWPSR